MRAADCYVFDSCLRMLRKRYIQFLLINHGTEAFAQ